VAPTDSTNNEARQSEKPRRLRPRVTELLSFKPDLYQLCHQLPQLGQLCQFVPAAIFATNSPKPDSSPCPTTAETAAPIAESRT